MIRVFTPYLAAFEFGDKKYLATLDRGIVVATTSRDDFPEHDAEIISSFRAAFKTTHHLTVIREYGFPTLMHDLDGLALNLAALAVHMGFAERVSEAIGRFAPQLLQSERSVVHQYRGGVYVEDGDGGLRSAELDGSLRIVAVKRDGRVQFIPTPRSSLVSKVMELVTELPASDVKVYSTNTLGTTLYITKSPDQTGT